MSDKRFIEGKPRLPFDAIYEIRNAEGPLRALLFELGPSRYGADIKKRGELNRSSEFSSLVEAKKWARTVLANLFVEG